MSSPNPVERPQTADQRLKNSPITTHSSDKENRQESASGCSTQTPGDVEESPALAPAAPLGDVRIQAPWCESYRSRVRMIIIEVMQTMKAMNAEDSWRRSAQKSGPGCSFDIDILKPQYLALYGPLRAQLLRSLEEFSFDYFSNTNDPSRRVVDEISKVVTFLMPAKVTVISLTRILLNHLPPACEVIAPTFTDWHRLRCRLGRDLWTDTRPHLQKLLQSKLLKREDVSVEILVHTPLNEEMAASHQTPMGIGPQAIATYLDYVLVPAVKVMTDAFKRNTSLYRDADAERNFDEVFMSYVYPKLLHLVQKLGEETAANLLARPDLKPRHEPPPPVTSAQKVKRMKPGKPPEVSKPIYSPKAAPQDLVTSNLDSQLVRGALSLDPQGPAAMQALVDAATGGFFDPERWPMCHDELADLLTTISTVDLFQLRREPLPPWINPHKVSLDSVGQLFEAAIRQWYAGRKVEIRQTRPDRDTDSQPNQFTIYTGNDSENLTKMNLDDYPIACGGAIDPRVPSIIRYRPPTADTWTGRGFIAPKSPSDFIVDDSIWGYNRNRASRLLKPQELTRVYGRIEEARRRREIIAGIHDGYSDTPDNVKTLDIRDPNEFLFAAGESQMLGNEDFEIIDQSIRHLRGGGLNALSDPISKVKLQIGPYRPSNIELGDPPSSMADVQAATKRRQPLPGFERASLAGAFGDETPSFEITERMWNVDDVQEYLQNPVQVLRNAEHAYLCDIRDSEVHAKLRLPLSSDVPAPNRKRPRS